MRMLLAWHFACTGQPVDPVEERPKPVIRIGGAPSMMAELLPSLTQTHTNTRGTLAFEVKPSSSQEGLRALLEGELDLAAATRAVVPSEEELAKALGWSFHDEGVRHIVGVDVTTVAVHADAPLEALTYDQVIGIFCTRTIDDWSFLGLDAKPLVALTLDKDSGDRALFEDFFCGPRGIHSTVREVTPEELEQALGADPSVVTYVSMSRSIGKPVALQADHSTPAVTPSQQNIISGAYPLYRDVYLYSAGQAAGYTRSMLDWILSPAGQEVVDEHSFVPLFIRPERLDSPRPLRETILFESGKSVPNQRSLARLKLLVDEIRQRNLDNVILEGFTDDREPNPDALSEKRAQAVQELLRSELPDLYFEVVARGADTTATSNDTPYGRQRNRRVQVYLAQDPTSAAALRSPEPSGTDPASNGAEAVGETDRASGGG